ncbi:Uncharacterized protein BP5553_06785 [Venustampulla echinocandica]|uniref:THO complex subunit 2 n=1 Tax=Venustampulla echinocandica TaxID=2656787 RepID=A0A370TKX3_9HELO|nr:Uncharacterized protein BP5553_06785 [Venustampulla echinocandica]RDL36173.1 Uncharacterized protein BP5553_06785 [Venustampulla echinocandica]
MAPGKRKRPERGSVDGGENRPSPHRPGNTNLGQHDRGPGSDMRDGGNRRSSRGGQPYGGGARGGRRNDNRDSSNSNKLPISGTATPTPAHGPMSPPVRPSSATQTPAPAFEPVVKRNPAPFEYVFLTEERMSSWEAGGRQEVIAQGIQARDDEDTMDLSCVFHELIRATLDGRISPTDSGNCVKEILGPDTALADGSPGAFDAQTFFVDSFSMICDAEEPPFNTALRPFAVATGVSATTFRQKLDAQLLQDLGLTRETFIRVGIRQATHMLYRQANYNLLREETEGYSKLITELFTSTRDLTGNEIPPSDLIENAFERLKGLIGTFDLDVGRVLDITLDVFASVLVKQYRFYVKLLRVSSWWPRSGLVEAGGNGAGLPAWALPGYHAGLTLTEDEEEALKKQEDEALKPQMSDRDRVFWTRAREIGLDAFYELGGRRRVDAETKARILSNKGTYDTEQDADRQWIEETGTLPPSGNRVAAQLLGFKLRFYLSPARDEHDLFPKNLIWLTALLIKIGFISLRDIYPHLWPSDDEMSAVKEYKMKELAEEERKNRPGGGVANALLMAGALADDTVPSGNRTRETTTAKTDATPTASTNTEEQDNFSQKLKQCDQKEWLLECLLTIGSIPESLFILGRFPWLPEAYPAIYGLINRIIRYSIKDVYDTARPTSKTAACPPKRVPDPDQGGVPKGQVRLAPMPARKLLRWPYAETFDTAENMSYRFYWDEWGDNIPVCQNVDDVFTLCGTLLNSSGVNIGRDAELLSKLARIGVQSLTDDRSPHNLERWQDLLKRLLVPALSLTKANTSVVNEVYDMLRFYPVSIRYSIYAEWFEGQISRLPAMKVAFARTRLETNHIMKRISMTNLTAMARSLAKTAYASPGIVFSVALSQIEAYTNLTEVVVECAKYFTDLAYDVLVWSLMSSLGGKDRNRTNAEFALLPSRWLLALSRFAGKVFKRYSIMNLSPIIRYVDNQLYLGNSTDLVILQELIAQMAGVVPDTDFTDVQLTAMTGGEVLRRQTLINLQDKRYESVKTAKRLMKALTETKLAGNLLISIAQHKQAAIYKIPDEDAHIKLLATMIDDAQLILFQYLDLLRSNLPVDEFDKHVPGIPDLLTEYGLEPPLAFMIGRASLVQRMAQATSSLESTTKRLPSTSAAEVTTEMEVDAVVESADETNIVNGNVKANDDVQMSDVKDDNSPRPDSSASTPATPADPCYEIMEPIISTIKIVLPESSFRELSPDFYATFWTSTLSDLSIPSGSYEAEIKRLRSEQESLMRDRSDMTRSGMAKKEDMRKHLAETREALIAELSKQVDAFGQAKSRLLKRKAGWFEQAPKPDAVSDAFLETCLIPRLLLSPSDADFCFRMIRFLHDNGVPNFRTLSLYGRIFRAHRLRSIIFTCSVREAENLGRFLRLVLADLARWHADAAVYEKEAWGGPGKSRTGFIKGLNSDGTPKGWLEYDGEFGYKNILYAWHKNLNTALRVCLEGTEWMHIRNAITVLKSVAEVFPSVDFMGNNFIKQLEAIIVREKGAREDLSLTGNAVLVQLRKRSRKWVMVQAFGYSLSKPVQTNGTATRSTSQSNVPSRPSLKPTAPEFKPQSRASSQGVSTPKPVEVEDGEVDDAKTSGTATNKPDAATKDIADAKPTVPAATPATEPKKSEVLLKREQFQREAAAKALASSQNTPVRPDHSRTSTPSSLDRGPSNLPSRPDAPFPPRHQLDRRHPEWRDGRDVRDSRMADPSRMDRPDRLGDRHREYPGGDRRGGDPGPRDFGRTSDRNAMPDRDRVRPEPPPRWTPDSSRENLDRTTNLNRTADSGRLSRETVMPPPRSSGVSGDRAPIVDSERVPPVNLERQELINSDRAALISADPRSDSPRRHRDEPRERRSPRPQSPRRYGSERDHPEARRDDRSRNVPTDVHTPSRGRNEDIVPPPVGPRNDRLGDRSSERGDRPPFQQAPVPPRSGGPDHGRLNMGARQQPDPNFGRLNPTPTHDIPSGPRDRNSRGNRLSTGPRLGGRPSTETPRPPTPDKQPPTGPSSGRHPRRSASGQFETPSAAPTSAPATPAASSPAGSIHPDRLRALGGPGAQPSPTPQSANAASGPIHPDRLKAFGNDQPAKPTPNTQLNNTRSRPQVPPVVTGGPPLGPKGSQPSPVTAGTNGLVPPTGPSSASERAARGGRRQFAAINNTLQQSNVPDRINVRGRGRISAGGPETPTGTSSGHAPPPPPPPPPSTPPPGRQMGRDGGRDLINAERSDLITPNEPSVDDRDKDRSGRRERSGRHSHRGSRSPEARPRDGKRVLPEDGRASRGEPRDRRGGEREPERERHQGRSPHPDLIAGRDVAGGPREAGREPRDRDPTRRGDGRSRDGGSVREPHDPAWSGERAPSGRNRDVRGDERRDTRGSRGDDIGRKRRSDDGVMDPRGHDKRPRRL